MMGGSVLPLVALFGPKAVFTTLLGAGVSSVLFVEALRLSSPAINSFLLRHFGDMLKEHEKIYPTSSTHFALSSLLSFMLYPMEISILSIFFLALGDPLAAFFEEGVSAGVPQLERCCRNFHKLSIPGPTESLRKPLLKIAPPHSAHFIPPAVSFRLGMQLKIEKRDLWRSGGCFLVCLGLGFLLGNLFHLGLPPEALILGAAGAAVAQLLPFPLDDNFTIPLLSGSLLLLGRAIAG